ncbi:MAG: glutathione S-transferase C-terminal domain-containing protein [Pseudomonadota bacterium]
MNRICRDTQKNAFQLTYYPSRFVDSEQDVASAERRGCRRLRETWTVVNDQLGDQRWVLGERFSAADIYLFMLTTWLSEQKGHPSVAEFANVERIASAVQQRPGVQRVYGAA